MDINVNFLQFKKKTFSDANTSGGAILEHQQLAEEVHKPNNKKFEKKKNFKKNIWGTDLENMQLVSKYN